jgi:hypothetical protein
MTDAGNVRIRGALFFLYESVTRGVPLEPPYPFRTFSLEASALSLDMSLEQQLQQSPQKK